MGFWHTGYMEFHEPTGGPWPQIKPKKRRPRFPCPECRRVFRSPDDLSVHLFDGHATERPVLTLHQRECGRSRLSVISVTSPGDWDFHNTKAIRVNGVPMSKADARKSLCAAAAGVVSVVLEGRRVNQEFEFLFSIADESDLAGVDRGLDELIAERSLTVDRIEAFIDRTQTYTTARRYRDGLVNYFYGVLARERSPQSGLVQRATDAPPYVARYDDALSALVSFDRPAAEAICGLVAFHYNQFAIALRKTHSPRVSRIAQRFESLLAGSIPRRTLGATTILRESLDYSLSDAEIEKVLEWSSLPLDGTAKEEVRAIESAISDVEPRDALKLHIVAAEHYLSAGSPDEGMYHVAALRHSKSTERWAEWYRERAGASSGS